jgi:protein TonB
MMIMACQAPSQGQAQDRNTPRQCRSGVGEVRVSCVVQADGSLDLCRVLREIPRGCGYAEAALNAARRSRIDPAVVRGAAVGARVTYDVRFQMVD